MRVLIAAPVRQTEEIFKYYLEGLENLTIPEGVEVDKFFIFHNSPQLIPLIKDKARFMTIQSNDEYKTDGKTHEWGVDNLKLVAEMKNKIIRFARVEDYDHLFFVDSDLVLQKDTLVKLLEAQKDIIAECFWTKWTPEDVEAPNAWDYDVYGFVEDKIKTWEKWRIPGVYQVGMTGACTLISKRVLDAGVNFDWLYNVSFWGEDRHFCIRAASHNFEIWLDTNCPPTHLYRQSEVDKYAKLHL